MQSENLHCSSLDYNSERPDMRMHTYGRHVQKMVDRCLKIEDRNERTRCAKTIVNIMATMQPTGKDEPGYRQKLWDNLFQISNYKLDVDAPYPIPRKEDVEAAPDKIPYPGHRIKLRHYGFLTEDFINLAADIPYPEERKILIDFIANHMKKLLIALNKDYANDERLTKEILLLSENRLELSGNVQTAYYREVKQKKNNNQQNMGKNKNKNKNKNKFKNKWGGKNNWKK